MNSDGTLTHGTAKERAAVAAILLAGWYQIRQERQDVSDEKRESTEEEAERLRRYLIIKVTVDWYKGPEGVMRVRS